MNQTKPPPLAVYILVPLLYYLGAKLGALTVIPEGTSILWPPNSIFLAALLLYGGRGYWPLALLIVGTEIAADVPGFTFIEALLFGLINVAEVTIAFVLLKRWRFDTDFTALSDLGKFVLAGPVVAALAAAVGGASVYTYFRGTETSFLEFLRLWWFGDAMGLMIFTPLWISIWPGRQETTRGPERLNGWDWLTVAGAAVALGALITSNKGQWYGVHVSPVLLLPFVILMAVRFRFRWVGLGIGVISLVFVMALADGRQPFGGLPARDAVLQAQEFIFIMSLLGLGTAALLSQLRAKQRELETANQRMSELNRNLEMHVSERTAELAELNAQLAHLALSDPLTGLMNRRAFLNEAGRQIEHSKRHSRPLAVLILDIDLFKMINDSHGHQTGDEVLRMTTLVMTRLIRASDVLARYGGEEFVILAPDTNLDGAMLLAERIRRAVHGSVLQFEGFKILVTVSIGVSTLREGDKDLDSILKRADDALYAAKAAGRDRVVSSE